MSGMSGTPERSNEDRATGPASAEQEQADAVRMTAWVHGMVQGVGFRWWTRSAALELGLVGTASNLADGRVEVVAEGPRAACERLLERLRGPRTPGSVDQVVARFAPSRGDLRGFHER